MFEPLTWGRALTGVALVLVASACDSVLGIEEPQDRPPEGGEAGAPPSSAGNGTGGTIDRMPPEGGAAGEPDTGGSSGEAGNGGAAPQTECTPTATRCAGDAQTTPQACDDTGTWIQNTDEASGDCPELCSAGRCTACVDGETRCSPCAEDDGTGGDSGSPSCDPKQPQKCVDGAWENEGSSCNHYCDAGECQTPTSCLSAGSRGICENGESCCSSLYVPGGSFKRDYDEVVWPDNGGAYLATISPFFLDKYEVTVGRLKQFVAAYPNLQLQPGQGKSDHIADDAGWQASYTLPEPSELLTMLQCAGTTWVDVDANGNVRAPANCVSFNVAYAFCIWDGGRLPTEAEWNFAASGGDEQRSYPWVGSQTDASFGYFGEAGGVTPAGVGLTPKGNGRWGHADLSGNVSEWVLDYYYSDLPTEICIDCLAADPSSSRSVRGGSFLTGADNQFSANRGFATMPTSEFGFRCARDIF